MIAFFVLREGETATVSRRSDRAPTPIAGVAIPDSALGRETTEYVHDTSTPLLFGHSRRVFLWASLQAERLSLGHDAELFYVGAMFHDLGLVEGHRSAHETFEIDGANAARAFLERHGLPEERVMTAWESIALHTTAAGSGLQAGRGATRGPRRAVRRPRLAVRRPHRRAARRGPGRASANEVQGGDDRRARGGRPRQAGDRHRDDDDRRPRSDRARVRPAQRLRLHPGALPSRRDAPEARGRWRLARAYPHLVERASEER